MAPRIVGTLSVTVLPIGRFRSVVEIFVRESHETCPFIGVPRLFDRICTIYRRGAAELLHQVPRLYGLVMSRQGRKFCARMQCDNFLLQVRSSG